MFAGIGGFRTGLTNSGDFFMPVGWCEKDKHAQKAYRLLYGTEGEYFCDDARNINPADMPDFDLICGGFPCQPFSVAGQRLGFADERGTLFHEICRLAEARHPKYLLLENVPGLLTHEGGQTFLASGAPSSQTKTKDIALTLSSTRPTKSGYTFKGWSESRYATSASYQPGGQYTANASTVLYAVWECSHPSIDTVWDTGCKWRNVCRICKATLSSGTTHGPYVYGNLEYYSESTHRRTKDCTHGDYSTYEYFSHNKTGKYQQYSSTQHKKYFYCNDCNSSIGTGYGISLAWNLKLIAMSGYSMPDSSAYTEAQSAYATFPEFSFSTANEKYRTLERVGGAYQFIANPNADKNERVHFIPVYVQDGSYAVSVTATQIWTPAGMITAVCNANTLTIDGTIYDDYYVGN